MSYDDLCRNVNDSLSTSDIDIPTIKRVYVHICNIYQYLNVLRKDLLQSSSIKDIVDMLCSIVDIKDISPLIALLKMLAKHDDRLAECIVKLNKHQEIMQPLPLSKECSSPPKSPVSCLFFVGYEFEYEYQHQEIVQPLPLSEECSSPPKSPLGSPVGYRFVGYASDGSTIYHSTAQVPSLSPEEPPGPSSETPP